MVAGIQSKSVTLLPPVVAPILTNSLAAVPSTQPHVPYNPNPSVSTHARNTVNSM